jgi:hypothetical protein
MLRQNPGFYQASLTDPWEATHETILYMCGLVRDSEKDPVIPEAAADALKRFAFWMGGDKQSPGVASECCWWWVKHAIKFVHHQKLLRAWLGKSDELQLLIAPDVLLRMAEPKGDCAVFTCLICSMLDSLGVPWEIVTVAVDPNQPEIFSHVYPRAILAPGFCLPLDASHGKYPGWQVPNARVLLKQVWNSNGEPIADQDSGYRGLHGMSGVGLNGLGQDDGATPVDEPIISYDTSTDLTPAQYDQTLFPTVTPVTTLDANGDIVTTSTSTTTSSSDSSGLDAALANFGAAWTKIAGQVIAPQVTQVGPGGTSITGPAAALQSILTGAGINLSSGSSSTLLLLGGLAVGAVLLFSMMSKK